MIIHQGSVSGGDIRQVKNILYWQLFCTDDYSVAAKYSEAAKYSVATEYSAVTNYSAASKYLAATE